MIDFRFNKKNTYKLLSASQKETNISKERLDWLLDNDRVVGTIHENWLCQNTIFMVVKDLCQEEDNDSYKLVCFNKKEIFSYLIEDILDFLNYIGLEELVSEDESDFSTIMFLLQTTPSSGLINIQKDKIFLYDQVS